MEDFLPNGKYYDTIFNIWALFKKYAYIETSEQWESLTSDVCDMSVSEDTPLGQALLLAVMGEIERNYAEKAKDGR